MTLRLPSSIMFRGLGLIALTLLVARLPAQTVGVSNLSFSAMGDTWIAADKFMAGGFTTDATYAQYTLTSVTIPINGPYDVSHFTVGLYNDAGNGQPGTLVGDLVGTSSPTSEGQYEFINGSLTLDANTTYWITWGFTSGAGYFGAPIMNTMSSIGSWSLVNHFASSLDGGTNWDRSTSGYLMQFSVQAAAVSAVPEPSTYAMIFGVAVLGLAVWRRRRACV